MNTEINSVEDFNRVLHDVLKEKKSFKDVNIDESTVAKFLKNNLESYFIV